MDTRVWKLVEATKIKRRHRQPHECHTKKCLWCSGWNGTQGCAHIAQNVMRGGGGEGERRIKIPAVAGGTLRSADAHAYPKM